MVKKQNIKTFENLLDLFFRREHPRYEPEIVYFYISGENEDDRQKLQQRIEKVFTSKEKTHVIKVKNSDDLFAKEILIKGESYLYIFNDHDKISEGRPFYDCPFYNSLNRCLFGLRHSLEDFRGVIYIFINVTSIYPIDPTIRGNCSLSIKTDLGFDLLSTKTLTGEYFFFNSKTERLARILERDFEVFIEALINERFNPKEKNLEYNTISEFERFQKIKEFLDTPEITSVIENSHNLKKLYKTLKNEA